MDISVEIEQYNKNERCYLTDVRNFYINAKEEMVLCQDLKQIKMRIL